jgi:hypothetical protein
MEATGPHDLPGRQADRARIGRNYEHPAIDRDSIAVPTYCDPSIAMRPFAAGNALELTCGLDQGELA